jgi:hypothetical protein
MAINRFVEAHNRDPKPFVWRTDPNTIIAAAKRGYQALDSIHSAAGYPKLAGAAFRILLSARRTPHFR